MDRLNTARIESLALRLIKNVENQEKTEDTRAELKSEWPQPEKAARQLAGHANAARGEEIVWLIGVDENRGVVGANAVELSNWWQSVQSFFDGERPSMIDLRLTWDEKSVSVLAFDTTRAPFVVNNPAFGKPKGGPVSLEVPWREGTSTRTASRGDLLSILVPATRTPEIEFLGGYLRLNERLSHSDKKPIAHSFYLRLEFYIIPKDDRRLVLPYHRCGCGVRERGGTELTALGNPTIQPELTGMDVEALPISNTLEASRTELIVKGPGMCVLTAVRLVKPLPDWVDWNPDLDILALLSFADGPQPILIELEAQPTDRRNENQWLWTIPKTDHDSP